MGMCAFSAVTPGHLAALLAANSFVTGSHVGHDGAVTAVTATIAPVTAMTATIAPGTAVTAKIAPVTAMTATIAPVTAMTATIAPLTATRTR
jgi:hypothetical protein